MQHFYEIELNQICSQLLLMGQHCVESVRSAVTALTENDGELARQVLKLDDQIDILEKTIADECLRYISLRGPVASELRLVTLPLRACHDLERVGDEACSIARRVPEVSGNLPYRFNATPLLKLTERSLRQLQDAIACFINRDVREAYAIRLRDKEIDALHRDYVKSLIDTAQQGNATVANTVDLIFISKSLERVGDHAKNLAAAVIYLMEGEDVRLAEEKRQKEKLATAKA